MPFAPGTEPHDHTHEPPIPGGEPHMPVPSHTDISIATVESAEAFISPKPDGEAEGEQELSDELQDASRKANPEGSTLAAMEK